MGSLTLVRHGQASFLAEDYDQLSPTGVRQAEALGHWWAARGVAFDAVYYGPAERHRATGEAIGCAYRRAGMAWPEPAVSPEFDEFAWLAIVKVLLPRLAQSDARIRELIAAYRAAGGAGPEAARYFDQLFHLVMPRWLDGSIGDPEVETWEAFRARARRGFDALAAAVADSRSLLLVTSAGIIGAAAAEALDLTPANTFRLTLATRNASWSRLRMFDGRLALDEFNCAPHLDSTPALLTYR